MATLAATLVGVHLQPRPPRQLLPEVGAEEGGDEGRGEGGPQASRRRCSALARRPSSQVGMTH